MVSQGRLSSANLGPLGAELATHVDNLPEIHVRMEGNTRKLLAAAIEAMDGAEVQSVALKEMVEAVVKYEEGALLEADMVAPLVLGVVAQLVVCYGKGGERWQGASVVIGVASGGAGVFDIGVWWGVHNVYTCTYYCLHQTRYARR